MEACSPIIVFLKSGICATSQSSRMLFSSSARSLIEGSDVIIFSACISIVMGTRISPLLGGGASREIFKASTEEKSKLGLRHINRRIGSNVLFSICSTSISSNAGISPVTPKVPSAIWRPARPATCASSAATSSRWFLPSNFRDCANAT